jgi:hypothetical protein
LVPSKRDRRRIILTDVPDEPQAPAEIRLISFGSPRKAADHCTYLDAPAEFAHCLGCHYNRGARGSGIMCAHRFGLDPTVVAGVKTQFQSGDILPIDD